MTTASPLLLSIPFNTSPNQHAVVIVHRNEVRMPAEHLLQAHGFCEDGHGGYISAVQASNGRWGYLNHAGRWVVEPVLDDAKSFSDEGLARFQQDGRWGYLNTAGGIVIAAQFEEARAFHCGLAAVKTGQDQWRFIDPAGAWAFEHAFFSVGDFSVAGLAPAVASRQNRLVGYIDRNGQWAISPRFKVQLAFGADGVAPATTDLKKYGLIDRCGNWVLPPTYRRIEEFNQDGLAYFSEENSWDDGHGYLNAQGEVVIKGDRDLSGYMADGIAATDRSRCTFLKKDGQELPVPPLSWGTHFNQFAFAVVRTARTTWSEALQQHQPTPPQWGMLHVDGAFRPAPGEVLEPWTDADGAIPYPRANTPLVPFLTRHGDIVFLDRDAEVAFRVRYDGKATLFDAEDHPLWRSASGQACQAPVPFFDKPFDAFLVGVETLDDTVACAEAMLAETEEKLHCFAAGMPVAAEDEDGDDDEDDEDGEDDEDDDDEDDEEDEDVREENRIVTERRLARSYLSEEHYGCYEFLCHVRQETIAAAGAVCLTAMQARFGESDPDPEHNASRWRDARAMASWPVKLRQPVTGSDNPFPEARELWLGLYESIDSGDGDVWHEIWLMCAPSLDALEEARRARARAGSASASRQGGMAADDDAQWEQPARPQTHGEWLGAVIEDKYAIGAVSWSLLDDALVDAAIGADPEALAFVPAPWQTPARLEALIRAGLHTAVRIPPQCMTAEGLALARALYGGDDEWQWRDGDHSELPASWREDSLEAVWGALLTEDHCLRAVAGGASLGDVPHWLRTARVEQAALEANIGNLRHIASERITPELAERAVWEHDDDLIGHIPEALLTPQLCLIAASADGKSLEHIPAALRSAEVCAAALNNDTDALAFVPDHLRMDVFSLLIELDRARGRKAGEERVASRWHGYRAWTRFKQADYEGALADATLAVEAMRYPQTAHYVLASAYRALGRRAEALLQASIVLSLEDPYTHEFDEHEDTSWLKGLTAGQFDGLDDAALIARIALHPRILADIPRARLTDAIIAAALAADPDLIVYVPKRLMTPQRYALALSKRVKEFTNIPKAMLSEEACIAFVRNSGYRLENVPMEWRTVQVCAHALKDSSSAARYVPAPLLQAAQAASDELPGEPDDD